MIRSASAPAASPAPSRQLPEGMMVPMLRLAAKLQPKTVARHQQAAQRFFEARDLDESIRRWKWVLAMQPGSVAALVGLGWALLEQRRDREAAGYLMEALARRPTLQEARWLLARATGCKQAPDLLPHTTPPRILRRDLPLLAPVYAQVRVASERVRVQSEIATRAAAHAPLSRAGRVLDLGCGTGLVGERLWSLDLRLEGVDLVPAMLAEAARLTRLTGGEMEAIEREFATGGPNGMYSEQEIARLRAQMPPVYNVLLQEDARDFLLRQTLPAYDLILASDVFPEIGGLTPIFDGAARALLPGGLLIASTNPGPSAGYLPQGRDVRFAHSEAYLDDQAARVGLAVLGHEMGPYDAKRTARYSLFRKAA